MVRVAWRECVAEMAGTFALCFVAAGAICTNSQSGGAVGLLGIAMASGLALSVVVSTTLPISGAQLNPAVTVALFASGRIKKWEEAAQLIAAQIAGAALAGYCLKAIFSETAWRKARLGTPVLANGVTQMTGMFLEAVLTFFLVYAVYATVVDSRESASRTGFAVGMTYAFGILLAGPLTGASMNPARAFGPALASSQWSNHLVYWVGPIVGALVAGQVYERFIRKGERAASAA